MRTSPWIALVVAGGMASCGPAEPAPLAVYAASSLAGPFGELEAMFEAAHPSSSVAVTFAGSQVLRIQIEEGAPADVYASADPEHVRALRAVGLMGAGRVFAHNELVVVVPLDNPAGLETFSDLPKARRIVLGTPEVPAGRYARLALSRADAHVRPGFASDVLARVVSEEPNVRLTRSKVEIGEADAAIVYVTDAAASDRVRSVPIPADVNVRADYLIGLVRRETRHPLAEAWVELVRSPEGRAVLGRHGFAVE